MIEESIIRISVRNLVEFILRSGDLDNRRSSFSDKNAMNEGSKLHRKLQKQMGSDYHAEVLLKTRIPTENYEIVVEGRADGIIIPPGLEESNGERVIVDEIKGVYMNLEHLEAPIDVHLAQAKCYAYIFAKDSDLKEIDVRMVYCNLDTEEKKYFHESYSFEELCEWFDGLIEKYRKWADFSYEWRKIRRESIKGMKFPFPYREGQKEVVVSAYRTIQRKKKLYIQAPTGVGKTISTVFPAVMAVGENLGDKIFYLTAKTITRTIAMEAFEHLKAQKLRFKTVILTAKEKMCAIEKMDCNPEACPFAKGHYERVNDAVYDLIVSRDTFTREVMIEHALKHQVCPFEMSLDVSNWSDGVICDYNYVFDLNVRLKRFFSEGVKGEYLFLIDEAHNLVERAREMYSAVLYKEDFLSAKRIVKDKNIKLSNYLERCNKQLLVLKRECENYRILPNAGSLVLALMQVSAEMEKLMEQLEAGEEKKELLEFYLQIRHFLNVSERVDENYVIYTEFTEDEKFKIKLYCMNPSNNLKECLDKGNSSIFFSATFLPIQYYRSLLGSTEEDYAIYADSHFDQGKRLLMIGRDVSSRYSKRTREQYQKYADYLYLIQKIKPGNYMMFFPSYAFEKQVYECFMDAYGEEAERSFRCCLQSSDMKESEREDFLENFSNNDNISVLGFCVMGGIFGEGIDLKNDQLIGAIIVGTGIPQICNEREILKNAYDNLNLNGFDYAYRYPGMNKVLQAAGRVIRTDSDEGMILLLDERFQDLEYRTLFPREWEKYSITEITGLEEKLKQFWNL